MSEPTTPAEIAGARPSGSRRYAQSVGSTEDDCWLWMGYRRADGYGIYEVGWPRRMQTFVHRMSYEMYVGPIPDGLSLQGIDPSLSKRGAS